MGLFQCMLYDPYWGNRQWKDYKKLLKDIFVLTLIHFDFPLKIIHIKFTCNNSKVIITLLLNPWGWYNKNTQLYIDSHTHTHTHTHVCMCVCMIVWYLMHKILWSCVIPPPYIYIYIYNKQIYINFYIYLILFTNSSAQAGYDIRSIFKRSLTGLNSEFSFS